MIIQVFKNKAGSLEFCEKDSTNASTLLYIFSDKYKLVGEFEVKDVKKKVKKTVEKWVKVYPTYISGSYESLEDAIEGCSSGRITSVKVIGEYEVEE